jgi:osmotically-inducible protein OsmY
MAAEWAVSYLAGVRGITNTIRLEPERASATTVKQDIETALKRHAELDASQIRVETKDGTVTLRGTVHSWAERREAESAAWGAPGVRRVEDNLTVAV